MSLIVFENSSFLIANKDHKTPTVPLKNQKNGDTLLEKIAEIRPEILSVCGKNPWEGGALHRLDTATAGLVLFAKTQDFYDHISKVQASDEFVKIYVAICDENTPITTGYISSYFRAVGPGSKMVKAEQDVKKADTDRLYTTKVKRLSEGAYECSLTRGFRHQIRVHLSTNGCPIVGDVLYNQNPAAGDMQLTCTGLQFPLLDGSVFTYNLQ